MGNLRLVTSNRRLGLAVGVVLGVVALAIVVAFAVLLPETTGGDDEVELPDALPGGWIAADVATPADGASTTDAIEKATEYVRSVYADVYDDPVAFRAYTDAGLSTFVVVTVFTSSGGAFGPPNGVADPEAVGLQRATTELVREGDAVCISNYQPVAVDDEDTEGSDVPVGVSCQLPGEELTVQLATNGLSVDDTVELMHDVEESLGD